MPRDNRILAAIAALVLVAAAAIFVGLTRGGDDGTASPEPVETSGAVPSDEDLGHEHEGDHVDTVDPDIDPADYVAFCDGFYVFANAYSNAIEALDQTGEAPPFLVSAAADFRAVADETEMTDEVRAGLEWFVDDVLRLENDASTEEQLAWSTFLNSACPA